MSNLKRIASLSAVIQLSFQRRRDCATPLRPKPIKPSDQKFPPGEETPASSYFTSTKTHHQAPGASPSHRRWCSFCSPSLLLLSWLNRSYITTIVTLTRNHYLSLNTTKILVVKPKQRHFATLPVYLFLVAVSATQRSSRVCVVRLSLALSNRQKHCWNNGERTFLLFGVRTVWCVDMLIWQGHCAVRHTLLKYNNNIYSDSHLLQKFNWGLNSILSLRHPKALS